MRRTRSRLAVLGAMAAILCGAPAAHAAVTFGATDVTTAGTNNLGNAAQGGALLMISGPTDRRYGAPTDGVIVRWRVRIIGNENKTIALRPLRPLGGTQYSPVSTTPKLVTTGATEELLTFAVRLPVKAGDVLGIDANAGGSGPAHISMRTLSKAQTAILSVTADGGTGTATDAAGFSNAEVLTNADLEPDADRDGFGDESQDQCPSDPTRQSACAAAVSPAQPDLKGPDVSLSRKTVTMSSKGEVPVSIGCPAAETAGCQGTVGLEEAGTTLARVRARLAARSFRVPGGRTTVVKVKLSRKGQRRVRRKRRLKVRAIVVARDAAGNSTTITTTFKVKAPKARKRKRKRR